MPERSASPMTPPSADTCRPTDHGNHPPTCMIHSFSFPTAIHFGAGARNLVPEHLRSRGVGQPLVVTDKGLAALPVTRAFVDLLEAGGARVALFGGVFGNPVESQVTAGVAAYRAHRADGLVGLGGGAALDVAKAIALMASHPGALFDYE